MKTNWTSRKFLVSAAGVICGVILLATGSTAEGTGMLVTSILGYLVAEGYIDAKALEAALKEEAF